MSETQTQIRERPIIFSGPMVAAILAGRKTQTRRVVKPQPLIGASLSDESLRLSTPKCRGKYRYMGIGPADGPAVEISIKPYATPGDRLWVRESCRYEDTFYKGSDRPREHFRGRIEYRDGSVVTKDVHGEHWSCSCESGTDRWRSPIHMPRWASRLTLEITDVRVEKAQEITEADAIAEGFEFREHFIRTWDALNEKRGFGFNGNPWVWALTFKVLTQ